MALDERLRAPPIRSRIGAPVAVRSLTGTPATRRRGRDLDRDEARALLKRELRSYAARSRDDLARLVGRNDAYQVAGPSGVSYNVEVDVLWDHRPGGTLRVIGSIDDGGFRTSLSPLTDSVLVDVDGRLDMA